MRRKLRRAAWTLFVAAASLAVLFPIHQARANDINEAFVGNCWCRVATRMWQGGYVDNVFPTAVLNMSQTYVNTCDPACPVAPGAFMLFSWDAGPFTDR